LNSINQPPPGQSPYLVAEIQTVSSGLQSHVRIPKTRFSFLSTVPVADTKSKNVELLDEYKM